MSIRLAAPAKINLHLGIYPGRDERGYHRADSVMIALGLSDFVTVSELPAQAVAPAQAADSEAPSSQVQLDMSRDVGVDVRHNTVWQAATRLLAAFDVDPARRFSVAVEKNIPAQSGLGGSSSDAASTILALCKLLQLDVADPRVTQVARSVGADVPFFLHPAPSFLTGAGDVLERAMPDLLDMPIVLVRPNAGVPTPAAYAEFDRDPIEPPAADAMIAALEAGDPAAVAAALYNNLEPAGMHIAAAVAQVKEWLAERDGVVAVQMTGSGSCVFAICQTADAAEKIASLAATDPVAKEWWAISTKTVGIDAHMC